MSTGEQHEKQITFKQLKPYQRFYTKDGRVYNQRSYNTCTDDYSLRPIQMDPDTSVWIEVK